VRPDRLETARLILHRPTKADAGEVFSRYASDPDVTKYLNWPRHKSISDTRAFLSWSEGEWERWPAGPYLVRSRETNQLLGGTGLSFHTYQDAMTGYVFAKDAWGLGYATESLRAMIDLSWQLNVDWLFALCHPAHHASMRVLEKCGFVRDQGWTRPVEFPNLAPGQPQDVACFAISRPDALHAGS
jgi:ribosomal-protein-alanine N-acetyltransferase